MGPLPPPATLRMNTKAPGSTEVAHSHMATAEKHFELLVSYWRIMMFSKCICSQKEPSLLGPSNQWGRRHGRVNHCVILQIEYSQPSVIVDLEVLSLVGQSDS